MHPKFVRLLEAPATLPLYISEVCTFQDLATVEMIPLPAANTLHHALGLRPRLPLTLLAVTVLRRQFLVKGLRMEQNDALKLRQSSFDLFQRTKSQHLVRLRHRALPHPL
jgi:hypothetical protein